MRYVFVVLFFLSCSSRSSVEGNVSESDSLIDQTDTLYSKKAVIEEPVFNQDPIISKKYLQGMWAKDPDENIIFTINNDSVFYFENPDPAYYELKYDTLYIFLDKDIVVKNRIKKITSDSLLMWDNEELLRLYKRSPSTSRY